MLDYNGGISADNMIFRKGVARTMARNPSLQHAGADGPFTVLSYGLSPAAAGVHPFFPLDLSVQEDYPPPPCGGEKFNVPCWELDRSFWGRK